MNEAVSKISETKEDPEMDIVFPMLGFPEIAVGKCAIVQEIHATNFLQVKKDNLRLLMPTKFKPDHVKKFYFVKNAK